MKPTKHFHCVFHPSTHFTSCSGDSPLDPATVNPGAKPNSNTLILKWAPQTSPHLKQPRPEDVGKLLGAGNTFLGSFWTFQDSCSGRASCTDLGQFTHPVELELYKSSPHPQLVYLPFSTCGLNTGSDSTGHYHPQNIFLCLSLPLARCKTGWLPQGDFQCFQLSTAVSAAFLTPAFAASVKTTHSSQGPHCRAAHKARQAEQPLCFREEGNKKKSIGSLKGGSTHRLCAPGGSSSIIRQQYCLTLNDKVKLYRELTLESRPWI